MTRMNGNVQGQGRGRLNFLDGMSRRRGGAAARAAQNIRPPAEAGPAPVPRPYPRSTAGDTARMMSQVERAFEVARQDRLRQEARKLESIRTMQAADERLRHESLAAVGAIISQGVPPDVDPDQWAENVAGLLKEATRGYTFWDTLSPEYQKAAEKAGIAESLRQSPRLQAVAENWNALFSQRISGLTDRQYRNMASSKVEKALKNMRVALTPEIDAFREVAKSWGYTGNFEDNPAEMFGTNIGEGFGGLTEAVQEVIKRIDISKRVPLTSVELLNEITRELGISESRGAVMMPILLDNSLKNARRAQRAGNILNEKFGPAEGAALGEATRALSQILSNNMIQGNLEDITRNLSKEERDKLKAIVTNLAMETASVHRYFETDTKNIPAMAQYLELDKFLDEVFLARTGKEQFQKAKGMEQDAYEMARESLGAARAEDFEAGTTDVQDIFDSLSKAVENSPAFLVGQTDAEFRQAISPFVREMEMQIREEISREARAGTLQPTPDLIQEATPGPYQGQATDPMRGGVYGPGSEIFGPVETPEGPWVRTTEGEMITPMLSEEEIEEAKALAGQERIPY